MMRILLYISLLFSSGAFGQSLEDLQLLAQQQATVPTLTEHYENRAGAADPASSTSIAGWVGGNAATFQSSTEQARTGTTSIKIGASSGEQFKYFDFSSGSNADLPDFSGGETVTISGWIYAPIGTTVSIQMTGSSLSKTQITINIGDVWEQFTYSGVSVTSSGNFYLYTNGTYTYLDDLTITSE